MPTSRCLSCHSLGAAGLLLLVFGATQARQPKDDLPKTPPNILKYKDNAGSDLKAAQAAFSLFAKYNAEYIANPRVYSNPQEFVPPRPRNGRLVQTTDQLLDEFNRHIFTPLPGSKIGPDQADYIRELGVALNKELKAVVDQNPSPIVKINAMRMLAAACRSGATALWPTITEYIANPNVALGVKYYAFQAAGNLLSAYDLNDYTIRRKHANTPKEVTALVSALKDAIVKPTGIVPAPKGGGPLSQEQFDVLRFIRREAIRALGQVRFAIQAPGVPPSPELYPAFTLAQIAVSDPAIVPMPSETEIAEAVIGLCNISPPGRPAERQQYASAMSEAVASGIIAFAARRAATPLDRTIPWRHYGARLSDAVLRWRPLFDPLFNPAKPLTYSTAAVPASIEALAAEADRRVLKPMYEASGAVDVNGLQQFRDNTLRGDKKWRLDPFAAKPNLVLKKPK